MDRCKTCKFWKQLSTYDNIPNDGKCSELKFNNKFEAILQTGWDGGYVDYIETNETFGCTEHKPKE